VNRHALWSTAACAAAFFACAPAWAQINKCVDARGKVSYQEQPCPGSAAARVIAAPAAPPPMPEQPAKDRVVNEGRPKIVASREQCAQVFADLEKARANLPNLRHAEQERLREVLKQEEAMWGERCRP
jgi:Domain of unknown function (DUF4124)